MLRWYRWYRYCCNKISVRILNLQAEWLAWAKCSEEGENLIWNELGFDVCNTALWSDEAFAYDESNTYNTFFRVKPYEVLERTLLKTMRSELFIQQRTHRH